jgi:hypothetical protein
VGCSNILGTDCIFAEAGCFTKRTDVSLFSFPDSDNTDDERFFSNSDVFAVLTTSFLDFEAEGSCPLPHRDKAHTGCFEADAERFFTRAGMDRASPACFEADAERPFSTPDPCEMTADCFELEKEEEEEEEEGDDTGTSGKKWIVGESNDWTPIECA